MKPAPAKLFICVPVHNRSAIVRECLPTLIDGMKTGTDGDSLNVYDDGSGDVDRNFLKLMTDCPLNSLITAPAPFGIERQRRRHFLDFWRKLDHGYTHLYLTDSDALHDPKWRSELLRLQAKYDDDPICGYDTDAHVRLAGNTIEDDPAEEVIVRKVAPGISYLLTVEHVRKVVRYLQGVNEYAHWHWDWTVPAILGNRFLVARRSLVSHCGWGGMHHPASEGYNGGDVARNPTEWLVKKRAEVVRKLEGTK
jgi:hypothetical protein